MRGLAMYCVEDDKFELGKRVDRAFSFPCNVCQHNELTDSEEPCLSCGHNCNYRKESEGK